MGEEFKQVFLPPSHISKRFPHGTKLLKLGRFLPRK
jgi:hypothetical protein